jgi:hypothetical protein
MKMKWYCIWCRKTVEAPPQLIEKAVEAHLDSESKMELINEKQKEIIMKTIRQQVIRERLKQQRKNLLLDA